MRCWWTVVLACALMSAGCVKGAGDPCSIHADCAPGFVCGGNSCVECGEEQSCVGIDIVLKTCDPQTPALDAKVKTLRMTIEGEGMTPFVQSASVESRSFVVPQLAFGKNRQVFVEALGETDEVPLARGVSEPFDLSAETPTSAVSVFVRRTWKFTPTNTVSAPTACTTLGEGRAAHTATRLADGRVLLAGGYSYDASSRQVFLKSAEIFEPSTGTFEPLSEGFHIGRAGHSAHLLPDGRVLHIGGYTLVNEGLSALETAELFDPATKSFRLVPMKSKRMRHASVLLEGGVVVVAGGLDEPGKPPLDSIEIFLPNAPPGLEFQGTDLKLGTRRASLAGVAVEPGRVFFIGGADENGPLKSIDALRLFGTTLLREEGQSLELSVARAAPSAFVLEVGDGRGVLVTGAPNNGSQTAAAAWDWLSLDSASAPPRETPQLPVYRFNSCSAPISGGVLAVGGVEQGTVDPDSNKQFLSNADVYLALPSGSLQTGRTANPVSPPRKHLACTSLDDGTVLVTGGEFIDSFGKSRASDTALVFQP